MRRQERVIHFPRSLRPPLLANQLGQATFPRGEVLRSLLVLVWERVEGSVEKRACQG